MLVTQPSDGRRVPTVTGVAASAVHRVGVAAELIATYGPRTNRPVNIEGARAVLARDMATVPGVPRSQS